MANIALDLPIVLVLRLAKAWSGKSRNPGQRTSYLGVGQNYTTRGPLGLVMGSIYQGSVLGYPFLTHSRKSSFRELVALSFIRGRASPASC